MGLEPESCEWWEKNRAAYERISDTVEHWGEGRIMGIGAPSTPQNQLSRRLAGIFERACASPAMARALIAAVGPIDVTDILPAIRVPTLVISRTGDLMVPVENSRDSAERIAGARYVELPGDDHFWWIGDTDRLVDEVEQFLTGSRHAHDGERVLATVLFTDIVASTERAAAAGDRAWRELLDRHDALLRREVADARGRVLKSMGDGYLVTFDGPARAIECAQAIVEESRELGIDVRAGVHTGECNALGDDVGGMAVNIGARVGAAARPGEVLVSSTVKDLVVGSGLRFADRGEHALKGVPGEWRLFAIAGAPGPPAAERLDEPHQVPLTSRALIAMARRSPKLASRAIRFSRRRGEHSARVPA
jgi:class 3 adenylate cyclase